MKLPRWAALLLILILLATGKAGRARAGVLDRARDEARAAESHHDKPDSDDDDSPRGGKLGRVRKEAREERDRDDDHGHGHRHRRRGGGDAVFTGFWFSSHHHHCPPQPCVTEVYTTSGLPPEEYDIAYRATFGDEFAPYPYAPGASGCLASVAGADGKEWLGHLGIERGFETDNVDRTGFTLFVEGMSGFGANFEWHSLTEDLAGGGHDELHLGEFDITYRLLESDYALVRAGLGLNWLGDRYDTDFGVNFTVGADFFPVRPIVLSTELDLGTVGDAQMLHLSGTAGWMMGRMELFGGYDYRRIGDAVIEGPLVGLRLWF